MSEIVHDPDAIAVLTDDECWDLLESQEYGRLAYVLAGEPGIVPVNYVVGENDLGRHLTFRTAEGSKLFALAVHDVVAFEVDEVGATAARSVIVRGHVRRVVGLEEELEDRLPLHPWVPTLKYNVMVIEPTEVTGRSFRLVRESREPVEL